MRVAHKGALGMAFVASVALGPAASAFAGGISDDIKIGVLTDMAGQFSHESGEGGVTAVKMAVDDFAGTVLGKPIEVVSADHQNNPKSPR
jgi:branched-chain amino acid transport system substrate-binding protein